MIDNAFVSKYLEVYLEHLDPALDSKTVVLKKRHVKNFLGYLSNKDVSGFEKLDVALIYEYIGTLKYASQTVSGVKFCLREFINVLHDAGVSKISGRAIFPIIRTDKRSNMLSYYEPEEISDLISQIDISKRNGVRDKCMILLAAQVGLRESDILGLKISEIKWDRNLIEKVQVKTKAYISVPLPENIKLLLIDYIKSYRPKSDSEYVFICAASGKMFCDDEVYAKVDKFFKKSCIDIKGRKHGPHALRHSLAARLLKENTPLHVIAGILGHKSTETTRLYLGIDVDSLRKMSLEVPEYED